MPGLQEKLNLIHRKQLFLFLALLLPVAVFVFLKLFGRNEFNVRALHQDSIPVSSADCQIRYTTPYRVADSVMRHIKRNVTDSLFVVYFDATPAEAMERLSVEFQADALAMMPARDVTASADMVFLKTCILLMEKDMSVILIDHKNRIRGYYDGADRDDVDRLIVEIKIILKKY